MLDAIKLEEARLIALQSLDILDTPPEENFDRITRLVRRALKAPIALISLIDHERQWFKSRQGLLASETKRSISFCSHAIEQDVPLVVPDASLDPRFCANPFVVGPPGIRSYVGAQLKTGEGYSLGTLCVLDVKPRRFSEDEIAILQDLAQLVIDGLELRRLATTDSLTGCLTRRTFFENAQRDFTSATRGRRPFACLMLDSDFFKGVNDTYGHAAGDRVLRRLAAICRSQLHPSDYMGRLGGEEFAIALYDTDGSAAFRRAEHLRTLIASETFYHRDRLFQVTVSIGIAATDESTSHFSELLERADRALYRSKARGRNRTSVENAAH
jgi:diguanylate cyclase (GGDEF)-like protein